MNAYSPKAGFAPHLFSRRKKGEGFTLVEALIYFTILSVVSAGSVLVLFDLEELFFQYQVQQELFVTGTASMERILTELRQADSVDLGESAFATSTAGSLGLANGATTTVIKLENGRLTVEVNGTKEGSLTTDEVVVEGFTVFRYVLGNGELIRVRLALTGAAGEYAGTFTLQDGAVIRGSYD